MSVLSNGLGWLIAVWAHEDRCPEYPQDKEVEDAPKKQQWNIGSRTGVKAEERNN
jgi:hypothetical protein